MPWAAAEADVGNVLAAHADPLAALARAEVPAIVLRGAYPAEHCAALIDRFVARGLMDPSLLDADSVQPRRVDIGTSLSNRAGDREGFLAHADQTRELFATLFAGHPDPMQLVYDRLGPRGPPGYLRELERCEGVRALAVESDGTKVSAAERGGVGVRGAGGHDDALLVGRRSREEPRELQWVRGRLEHAVGTGGLVSRERVRVARGARERMGVGRGLSPSPLCGSAGGR